MKLSPFETFRKTTNTLYTLVDGSGKYLVKCYCGARSHARRRQEKLMLSHWKQANFSVPEIYDKEVPRLPEPYLVTSFIEGISLREYLSQSDQSVDEKVETLRGLFRQLARRHILAVKNNDRHLVHYDPSSGNIICTENGFYFVDFEAAPKSTRSVLESASIEIATTCRWVVRDLGIEFLAQVLKVMVAAYKGQEPLLNLIVKRTASRPFQFYHRWKKHRHKIKNPNDVTKYDIADGLAEFI